MHRPLVATLEVRAVSPVVEAGGLLAVVAKDRPAYRTSGRKGWASELSCSLLLRALHHFDQRFRLGRIQFSQQPVTEVLLS